MKLKACPDDHVCIPWDMACHLMHYYSDLRWHGLSKKLSAIMHGNTRAKPRRGKKGMR